MKRPIQSMKRHFHGRPATASWRTAIGERCAWISAGYRRLADLPPFAIRPLAGQRLFAELPEQVELILGRDDEHLVLHLINQSGARRKSFGPHLTITGGRLRLKGARMSREPELLVSGEAMTIREVNGDLPIDLPPLELFEVIRLKVDG